MNLPPLPLHGRSDQSICFIFLSSFTLFFKQEIAMTKAGAFTAAYSGCNPRERNESTCTSTIGLRLHQ